ncbi:hypothetical protein [Bradyrhizobium sp. F1.13.3]|uniref:hypothetical protein n=1 Tax=Bradyrhizobium sp. F1.13.3 TaxID=3156351 RepID=UPI00339860F1
MISLQGGSEFLGRLFGDKLSAGDNKPAAGYFGAIIGGALFLLSSSIFLLHTRRHGDQWHSRIPVLLLEGLNTTAWEAKIYQACVVLLFIGVPLAGTALCMIAAESGDICEQDTTNVYLGKETTLLWAPVSKQEKQMRLRRADSGQEPCKGGVELFPRSWTPLAFYLLPLAAISVASLGVISLFSRRKSLKTMASQEVE